MEYTNLGSNVEMRQTPAFPASVEDFKNLHTSVGFFVLFFIINNI